ncbi:MAG: hypothetical protein LBK71_08230 [Verrucomicrobiales bacterium]|jgi:hypothetical protein|nr:hypothetical protein [Verrucomicrobiales bacterium]
MSIAEIKAELPKLTLDEKLELARELDVDGVLWDAQIRAASAAGRLDFLFAEADAERAAGQLKPWPSRP